ncbi:unnamed protein product, partial [Didymodactylos carnosus]
LGNNIEYCHRSRSSLNQATSTASTRPPAIVVRFISRFDRQAVLSSLGHLKKQNTGMTITEDLTPGTLKLFHETRNKLNGEEKKRVTTRMGFVFLRDSISSRTMKRVESKWDGMT